MTDEGTSRWPCTNLVGISNAFEKLVERALLAASCDSTVLLQGETGTGKGVWAKQIHDLSHRADGPFVTVPCGVSADLIENELFGHERGAFTGADKRREGLVHTAENGTLFLDDVDLLSRAAQGKLLWLLENRAFRALGSGRTTEANVRVIGATNVDLLEAVRAERIREDFYFRLNAIPLRIKPLRERREDILPLARRFLAGHSSALTLAPRAATVLVSYNWPGNVRELRHVIEGAVMRSGNETLINESDIELPPARIESTKPFAEAKREFERSYLERILAEHEGNLRVAARAAGLSRRTLQRLREKHAIDLARFRAPR